MDAHLIGIDLAHLLLKHNARAEKERPPQAADSAAAPAMTGKDPAPKLIQR